MGKGECGGGGREKGERGNPPRQAGFTILAFKGNECGQLMKSSGDGLLYKCLSLDISTS